MENSRENNNLPIQQATDLRVLIYRDFVPAPERSKPIQVTSQYMFVAESPSSLHHTSKIPKSIGSKSLLQEIRDRLFQFYQQRTASFIPLDYEKAMSDHHVPLWPVCCPAVMVVLPTKKRALYLVKELHENALPDQGKLAPHAIIVTAVGEGYFIENHQWLYWGRQRGLIKVTGIIVPNHLKMRAQAEPQLCLENAESMIEAALFRYQMMITPEISLVFDRILPNDIEKYPIAIMALLDPVDLHKTPADSSLRRILLTGKAGTGKSTLLQYIAYRWSLSNSIEQKFIPELPEVPLWQKRYDWVFWLPLKLLYQDDYIIHVSDGYVSLAHFIAQAYKLYPIATAEHSPFLQKFTALLRSNWRRILLLVDDFDQVIHWLLGHSPARQFLIALFQWPGAIVLTTRPEAKSYIPADWQIDRWIETQAFSAADIDTFVKGYFQSCSETDASGSQRFMQLLQGNRPLWDLARIPILLRLLCISWQYSMRDLQERAEEFSTHVTLTEIMCFLVASIMRYSTGKSSVTSWYQIFYQKDASELFAEYYQSLMMLAELAFKQLQIGRAHISISQLNFLDQPIGQFGFLKPAVSSPAEISNVVLYEFIHLVFQEYLAAWYLTCHLQDPELQLFTRMHRYSVRYQNIFLFAAGLIDHQPERQQQFWELLTQSPNTLDGLAELRLGLICLNQSMNRRSIQDKRQILIRESQRWIKRLMSPKAVNIDRQHYIYSQLLPVWQQLWPQDGKWILDHWRAEFNQWLQASADVTQVTTMIQVLQALKPVGAVLLDWLPETWISCCIQQLKSPIVAMQQQALQILSILSHSLLRQEGWVVGIVEGITSKTASIRNTSFKLILHLNSQSLLMYETVKQLLVNCLQSCQADTQQLACRIINDIGQVALEEPAIRQGMEVAWWSWDLSIHALVEQVLQNCAYKMPSEVQISYSVIRGIQADNHEVREISVQILKNWGASILDITGFRENLLRNLEATYHYRRQLAFQILSCLGLSAVEEPALQTALLKALAGANIDVAIAALGVLLGRLEITIFSQKILRATIASQWGLQDPLGNLALKTLDYLADERILKRVILQINLKEIFTVNHEVCLATLNALIHLGPETLNGPALDILLETSVLSKNIAISMGICSALKIWEFPITLSMIALKTTLVTQLASTNGQEKLDALQSLKKLGYLVVTDPELKAEFIKNLLSPFTEVRIIALNTLSALEQPVAVYDDSLKDAVIQGVICSNIQIRIAAMHALRFVDPQTLHEPRLKSLIVEGLNRGKNALREICFETLMHFSPILGAEQAQLELTKRLASEDIHLHILALHALKYLRFINIEEAILKKVMMTSLIASHTTVLIAAFEALEHINVQLLGWEVLSNALISGLFAKNCQLRLAAHQALCHLAQKILKDETEFLPVLIIFLINNLYSTHEHVLIAILEAIALLDRTLISSYKLLKHITFALPNCRNSAVLSAILKIIRNLGPELVVPSDMIISRIPSFLSFTIDQSILLPNTTIMECNHGVIESPGNDLAHRQVCQIISKIIYAIQVNNVKREMFDGLLEYLLTANETIEKSIKTLMNNLSYHFKAEICWIWLRNFICDPRMQSSQGQAKLYSFIKHCCDTTPGCLLAFLNQLQFQLTICQKSLTLLNILITPSTLRQLLSEYPQKISGHKHVNLDVEQYANIMQWSFKYIHYPIMIDLQRCVLAIYQDSSYQFIQLDRDQIQALQPKTKKKAEKLSMLWQTIENVDDVGRLQYQDETLQQAVPLIENLNHCRIM